MTHPGMAPVFAGASQTGPGQYAGDLDFTMAGDWALIIRASLPNGITFERQIPVKGVGTPLNGKSSGPL